MKKRLLFICTLFTLTASAQISKPRREYVEYLISTNHIDRNYQTGQPAYVKLQAFAGGVPLENTYVHYTHGDEMMSQSASDSILIRGGEALIPVGTRLPYLPPPFSSKWSGVQRYGKGSLFTRAYTARNSYARRL